MIKMKRMAAILLTLTMAASLFTGCGEKEKEVQDDVNQVQEDNTSDVQDAADSQRISEETINVTISGRCGQSDCVWNDTIQFAEYESRLGIKFDATTYAPADWASQVSLMFASDELPDMFANAAFTSQEVAEFGKDGYFLDLAEYLDVMPNLQAIFDEYPEYYAACVDEEGHIYALPQLSLNPACGNIGDPTYFRKDWCENLGLEVPETLDDLYNVLKAFKEQDADGDGDPNNEIPFLYRQSNGLEMVMLRSFGIYSNNLQYPLVVDDAGKISLASATDNYKAYLTYMHKLYEEGLMNQDAFVITEDEKIAIQKTGVAGMFSAWTGMPEGTKEEQVKDMSEIKISIEEEKVIVRGCRPEEDPWGAWQFPIPYNIDGKLFVSVHVSNDDINSFGNGQECTIINVLGIAAMLAALALVTLCRSDEKTGNSFSIILAIISMLFASSVGIVQKIYATNYGKKGQNEYVFLAFLFMAFFAAVLKIINYKKNSSNKEKITAQEIKKFYIYAIAVAMCVAMVNKLNMILITALPGVLYFPVYAAGTVLCSAIFSRIFLKEKLLKRQWIGIFVGVCAIVMIVL